ncbi:MAG TPA: hypothetical protein VNQ90_12725 [Chthoniobacteraceae bacterium]|nr:hypothetical protein [Chthoniobacteraceae bacterium]
MQHQRSFLCRLGLPLTFAIAMLFPGWSNAADRTWTQGAGGDFLEPSNWINDDLPSAGDTVYFDAAGLDPYTVEFHDDFELRSGKTGRIYLQTGNQAIFKLYDDEGSYALSSFSLQVNHGTLTLDGGTTTVNEVLTVGAGEGGSGTLKLTNGAVLNGTISNDYYRVGNSASGAMVLEQGSSATFVKRLQIGYKTGGGGSSVTVSEGSSLEVIGTGGIYLGSSEANVSGDLPTATSDNSLSVSGGSTVSTSRLYIGYREGADNNTVVVGGAAGETGSTLTVSGFLRVGIGSGSGAVGNSLTIRDGGELTASDLFQVAAGNTFTVEEGGRATSTNTGLNNSIRGTIAIKGGQFTAGTLHIRNLVTLEGGSFELTADLYTFADSRFEFTLDNNLTINVGGKLTVDGITSIDITGLAGGAIPGTYTLFSSTTASGLDLFTLGNTFEGFEGALSYDANHLYLNVTAIPEPGAAWFSLLAFPLLWQACRHRPGITSTSVG